MRRNYTDGDTALGCMVVIVAGLLAFGIGRWSVETVNVQEPVKIEIEASTDALERRVGELEMEVNLMQIRHSLRDVVSGEIKPGTGESGPY